MKTTANNKATYTKNINAKWCDYFSILGGSFS